MQTKITDTQIKQLSTEAARAGDAETVRLCWTALHGATERTRKRARAECAQIVADARAMLDPEDVA